MHPRRGADLDHLRYRPLYRLADIVQLNRELTSQDRKEAALTDNQHGYIEHWNRLLKKMREEDVELPSFPIWGDEFDATYPFEESTPFAAPCCGSMP